MPLATFRASLGSLLLSGNAFLNLQIKKPGTMINHARPEFLAISAIDGNHNAFLLIGFLCFAPFFFRLIAFSFAPRFLLLAFFWTHRPQRIVRPHKSSCFRLLFGYKSHQLSVAATIL
ncbi:putative transcriptional regulator [Escherichia phage vB_EcoD_Mishu]|uniref:Transcriptional regulator n=1 Tax=Escherichia phage vB_EcoD_Mishu TaxID=2894792 RepID=A0AAE8YS59_9CAUD|nr:putative transcriptional regulator [Escherichia phage vB_EcoD_Mishu]